MRQKSKCILIISRECQMRNKIYKQNSMVFNLQKFTHHRIKRPRKHLPQTRKPIIARQNPAFRRIIAGL